MFRPYAILKGLHVNFHFVRVIVQTTFYIDRVPSPFFYGYHINSTRKMNGYILSLMLLPTMVTAQTEGEMPAWEIGLAAGSGAIALLLCGYAIFIIVRRKRSLQRGDVETGVKVGAGSKGSSEQGNVSAKEKGLVNGKGAMNGKGAGKGAMKGAMNGAMNGKGAVNGALNGKGTGKGAMNGAMKGTGKDALNGKGTGKDALNGALNGKGTGKDALNGKGTGKGPINGKGTRKGNAEIPVVSVMVPGDGKKSTANIRTQMGDDDPRYIKRSRV